MAQSSKKIEAAFLAAYDEYADSLYRFIYYKVYQNKELAEELLQDTFFKVWRAVQRKGGMVAEPQAFMYKTARNLIIDHVRKKKVRLESLEEAMEEFADDVNIGEVLDIQIDVGRLQDIMKKLPDQYIEVLQLRFMEEKTIEEITTLLDSSKNAVSVKIHRAVAALKKQVDILL